MSSHKECDISTRLERIITTGRVTRSGHKVESASHKVESPDVSKCQDVKSIFEQVNNHIRNQAIEKLKQSFDYTYQDVFSDFDEHYVSVRLDQNQAHNIINRQNLLNGQKSAETIPVKEFTNTYLGGVQFDDSEDLDSNYEVYVNAIRSGAYGHVITDGYRLPGNLTYRDACQHMVTKGCVNDHTMPNGENTNFVKRVRYNCRQLSCTKCFLAAINGSASSITDRILTGLIREKTVKNRQRMVIHITVSPSKSDESLFFTPNGDQKVLNKVKNMLKSAGIDGWAQITHMWRFSKGDPSKHKPYKSLHFHCVCVGYLDYDKVKKNHEKTGYVIRKLSVLPTEKDVFACVRYLLTHAAIRPKKQAVKYYGDFGNNKFRSEKMYSYNASFDSDIGQIKDIVFKEGDSVNPDSVFDYSCSMRVEDQDTRDIEVYQTGKLGYDSFYEVLEGIRAQNVIENRDYPVKAKSKILHYITIKKSKSQFILCFDPDTEELCPMCQNSLKPLMPYDVGGSNNVKICNLLEMLPDDMLFPVSPGLFKVREYTDTYHGMHYFEESMDVMGTVKLHYAYDYNIPRLDPYVKLSHDEVIQFDFDSREALARRSKRLDGDYWSSSDSMDLANEVMAEYYPEAHQVVSGNGIDVITTW